MVRRVTDLNKSNVILYLNQKKKKNRVKNKRSEFKK